MRIYVGIDPGLRGGTAALDVSGRLLGVWAALRDGKDFSGAGLAKILKDASGPFCDDLRVCVEKVHAMPGQGVSSTFKFGQCYGIVLGVCAALSLSVDLVPPVKWQRSVLGTGAPGTTKARALAYARLRWPQQTYLATPRCRAPHDGMVDAACIAEYLRRRECGEKISE